MIRKAYPLSFTRSARGDVLSSSKIFDNSKGATVLIATLKSQQTATPPEPEPTAQSVQKPNLSKFVREFVTSGNTSSSVTDISFYADEADYFDNGKVTKAFIVEDINKYNQRWPQRHYWVNAESDGRNRGFCTRHCASSCCNRLCGAKPAAGCFRNVPRCHFNSRRKYKSEGNVRQVAVPQPSRKVGYSVACRGFEIGLFCERLTQCHHSRQRRSPCACLRVGPCHSRSLGRVGRASLALMNRPRAGEGKETAQPAAAAAQSRLGLLPSELHATVQARARCVHVCVGAARWP